MIKCLRFIRAKHVIITILTILTWQLCFPYHASAQQVQQTPTENEVSAPLLFESVMTTPQTLIRLPVNSDKPQPIAKQTMKIAVTAYSSTPDQTCGDPFITASGSHVQDGVIAANFLPIGTKVRFPKKFGNKIFFVEDRMSQRYWYRADIWMPTREQAKEWGVKYTTIEIL